MFNIQELLNKSKLLFYQLHGTENQIDSISFSNDYIFVCCHFYPGTSGEYSTEENSIYIPLSYLDKSFDEIQEIEKENLRLREKERLEIKKRKLNNKIIQIKDDIEYHQSKVDFLKHEYIRLTGKEYDKEILAVSN